MLSALYSIYDPEFGGMPGVIVFEGAQGKGKGEWIKKLCPIQFVRTEHVLEASSKDSIEQATTRWITELSEIAGTYKRSEINALKAFILAPYDTYRKAYARNSESVKRKTAFIATSNDSQFLTDKTGNRRWWTVSVQEINYRHKIDMQQLWAEIKIGMMDGMECYLNEAQMKILNDQNQAFEVVEPIEEMIVEKLESSNDYDAPLSTTAILNMLGIENPTKAQATIAGNILMRLNFKRKITHGYRLYYVRKKIYKL